MTTAAVFGCTGAVGSHILNTLLDDTSGVFKSVKTVSRRLPKRAQSSSTPNLESLLEPNTSQWGPLISKLQPLPSVIFNAVGTTRSAAGGIQQQWKIDHDLCIENARAAKDAGVKTYVFVSSAGTRGLLYQYVPYSKMKIGVEDAIKSLGFENAIVLRPGMILGERENGQHKSLILETLLGNLHWISRKLQDAVGMVLSSPPPPLLEVKLISFNIIQAKTKRSSEGQLWPLRVLHKKKRLLPIIGFSNRLILSNMVEMSGKNNWTKEIIATGADAGATATDVHYHDGDDDEDDDDSHDDDNNGSANDSVSYTDYVSSFVSW